MNKSILKVKINNLNDKSKNILINAFSTLLIKGGGLFISLFTLPAYIKYFNDQEVLGFWFTLLSVLAWILAFDIGIGNGLRNRLVPTFLAKNHLLSKKYISSAYVVSLAVVALSIFAAFIIFKYINWNSIFNISNELVSEELMAKTVFIVFLGIMLQFLFRLINSILYALQKSAINNLLSLLTSILIFIYVSTASPSEISNSLLNLAVVYVLAVNLPLITATLLIFRNSLRYSAPNLTHFEIKYAKEIMILGGIFFWVQIMYMILSVTNEFIISWLSGPSEVVEYQIYYKIFTITGTLFMIALTPIWSAVTKALAEKDYYWIKELYNKLKIGASIVTVGQFLIIPLLQPIIDFWLHDNSISINYWYALVFAISGSLFVWVGVLSTISNGLGILKIQSIFYTVGVIIKLPLAWFLVGFVNSWIGVVIANIIALSLFCIIQPIFLQRYIDKKIKGDEKNVQK